jgi:hypothetical protein
MFAVSEGAVAAPTAGGCILRGRWKPRCANAVSKFTA